MTARSTTSQRRAPDEPAAHRPPWLPRLLFAGGLLVAGTGLFTLYLRQSLIAPFNADGASVMLQAQAMLHGNVLLSGWWTADVSFYTTELPEYMLVVLFRGLRPDVVHICGEQYGQRVAQRTADVHDVRPQPAEHLDEHVLG